MTTEASNGHFWGAKQAAGYLGVSVFTIYRYCNGKTLIDNPPPFRRTSRNVLRFPIEQYKAWCHRYDFPK